MSLTNIAESDPAIIEAAARAECLSLARQWSKRADDCGRLSRAVLESTPLIRAAALEEAAQVVENYPAAMNTAAAWDVAAIANAIRALKEQP